jgi:hypothetical protein
LVSSRRKYQHLQHHLQVDSSHEPVSTAPATEQAKPPEPVADAPQIPEPVKTESPVDKAANNAIKQRLEEAERAAEHARGRAQQQPPQQQFAEPETPAMEDDPREQFERSVAALPERQQAWFKDCPQELWPERVKQIEYNHFVSARETGEIGTPAYYDHMDRALGVRNVSPQPEPAPSPVERPRSAPVRPRYAAPVSAPPSRETASMTTGHYVNERTPLSREELEVARASKISPQEYAKQKEKMLRLKASGVIQDGG